MVGPWIEIFNNSDIALIASGFMKDYIENGDHKSFVMAREILDYLECRGNFNLKSKCESRIQGVDLD